MSFFLLKFWFFLTISCPCKLWRSKNQLRTAIKHIQIYVLQLTAIFRSFKNVAEKCYSCLLIFHISVRQDFPFWMEMEVLWRGGGMQMCDGQLIKNIVFYRKRAQRRARPGFPETPPYLAESLFLKGFASTWKGPIHHGTMENRKPQARARLLTVARFLQVFCSIPLSLCFSSVHASMNFKK